MNIDLPMAPSLQWSRDHIGKIGRYRTHRRTAAYKFFRYVDAILPIGHANSSSRVLQEKRRSRLIHVMVVTLAWPEVSFVRGLRTSGCSHVS